MEFLKEHKIALIVVVLFALFIVLGATVDNYVYIGAFVAVCALLLYLRNKNEFIKKHFSGLLALVALGFAVYAFATIQQTAVGIISILVVLGLAIHWWYSIGNNASDFESSMSEYASFT